MLRRQISYLLIALCSLGLAQSMFATAANVWHIPDNNTDLGGTHMRDPWMEISNSPSSPTTITIYEGIYKGNGSNQTGGTLFYKGASAETWNSIALSFFSNSGSNQYWKANFSTSGMAANDPIQYYIYVTTDGSNGYNSAFIYAPSSYGDHGGVTLEGTVYTNSPTQATAAASPFTIRNRAAWIFHSNNRVNSGNDVQVWSEVGYVGDTTNNSTRWATNGAVYYTTDGTNPVPGATPGTAGNSATSVALASYDHADTTSQTGSGSGSIAGTPMWWMATMRNVLATSLGTTIKYKVGFWNNANNEQKFGDYNAGSGGTSYLGAVFTFTNGTVGDPVLTVNGTNANYTTTHVFIDETKGDSASFVINFAPGQPNVTAAEVYSNLNRRDKAGVAYTDTNGIATEEGIEPVSGDNIVAGDDSHYYKAYPMTSSGLGNYTLTLPATKTGAYRITARWRVQGDTSWRYYTNIAAGRRDHAVVVSPITARNINLYEANVFNLDSSGADFASRGTLEDMYDAPNAPHQGTANHWNLTYLQNLGCNWLWFQPIHPITEEAQLGHDPGSPYSVRSFFDIDPYMTTNCTSESQVNDATVRTAALQAFQGLVGAANNAGVGIMLDAPFNHTAPDCEVSAQGTGLFGGSSGTFFRDTEARFYSRDPDGPDGSASPNYAMRAFSSTSIAVAPDRGDFGKWSDVRDVYFGRYAALVDINPDDNGNYLNEQDWFDYSIGSDSSYGSGNGHFDQVTQNVWKYFSNYTLYWLSQTGVPDGSSQAIQTSKGIGGLRADFGQGLPPQLWEYIINKTRTRKWNFVFMAESLDGGAVTYRSNRHFDILNENIVFPLKNASTTSDFRGIFDTRRSSYGQGLVLLNNMSHDEEAYADPWWAVIRYAVCSTIDGVPLIFPGQELGISTSFGYSRYETNFGKQIADFKDFNSMAPAWADTNYGNDQLYPVYAGIGQARLFSPALRSSNRYYLDRESDGAVDSTIFSVAKYEVANGSPATTDVVLGFVNLDRDAPHSDTFNVNITQNGSNLFGMKPSRTYNVRNIAADTAQDASRRTVWLWGNNGRTGSDVLTSGVFVSMNKVPTQDGDWVTAPYEAQYLKLYDVTAPSTTAGSAATPNAYFYSIGNSITITWTAAAADSEGQIPTYKINYTIDGVAQNAIYTSNTSTTITSSPGHTVVVTVQTVNPNDSTITGPSSAPTTIRFIDPSGDDDGDGMTNAAEDTAGTNPFDPTSFFHVTNVSRPNPTSISFTWSSVPGRKYQLETAATPTGSYTAIGGVVTATGISSTQSVTTSAPSFYHVRIVP